MGTTQKLNNGQPACEATPRWPAPKYTAILLVHNVRLSSSRMRPKLDEELCSVRGRPYHQRARLLQLQQSNADGVMPIAGLPLHERQLDKAYWQRQIRGLHEEPGHEQQDLCKVNRYR